MTRFLNYSILAASLTVLPAQAEISYADILADPDNPVLNQQFARERLAGGDAKAALAAVERVLVAEPTNLGARLFRAEVLAALGADLQAEGELRALAALPLPADIKTRVEAIQASISQRRKRFNLQANLAFGYTENDNAANWPSDNTVLLNGEAVPTSGDNAYEIVLIDGAEVSEPLKDDTVNSLLALTGSYDLGSENWRSVFISTAMNTNSGGESGYMDGETISVATGLVYKNHRFTVTPRLTHAKVDNDYEDRLGSYGIHGASLMTQYQAGRKNLITLSVGQTNLRFEGDKKSNDTDTLSTSFSWESRLGSYGIHGASLMTQYQAGRKNLITLSVGQTNLRFDGDKKSNDTDTLSTSFGWESRLGNRLTVHLSGFVQDVEARSNKDLTKSLTGTSLSLRMALMRGHFLTLGGSAIETEHEHVYSQSYNPATETEADGKKRKDEITGTNLSYLLLGSVLSPKLSPVFFTVTYQSNETESNTIGFSQERDVLSARVNFSYRF